MKDGLTSNGRCRNQFPTSGIRSIKKNTCGTPNAISHPQNQRVEKKASANGGLLLGFSYDSVNQFSLMVKCFANGH
jgi:hypothetical protein